MDQQPTHNYSIPNGILRIIIAYGFVIVGILYFEEYAYTAAQAYLVGASMAVGPVFALMYFKKYIRSRRVLLYISNSSVVIMVLLMISVFYFSTSIENRFKNWDYVRINPRLITN